VFSRSGGKRSNAAKVGESRSQSSVGSREEETEEDSMLRRDICGNAISSRLGLFLVLETPILA
jgi:hypothetical protein